MVYTITTQGRLTDPRQFEEIIVRANPDGSALRLKDVGRVELGSKDYDFIGRVNGRSATLVGIFLQPGANALKVGGRGRAHDGESRQDLPQGHRPVDAVRHHALRERVDRGSDHDAVRGDGPRGPGRLPVPAELACHLDPGGGGAGVADRHVGRAAGDGLLDQHADAVRHGAGDRHRRRRRDRRARERRAHHARGEAARPRGGAQGDARGLRRR